MGRSARNNADPAGAATPRKAVLPRVAVAYAAIRRLDASDSQILSAEPVLTAALRRLKTAYLILARLVNRLTLMTAVGTNISKSAGRRPSVL